MLQRRHAAFQLLQPRGEPVNHGDKLVDRRLHGSPESNPGDFSPQRTRRMQRKIKKGWFLVTLYPILGAFEFLQRFCILTSLLLLAILASFAVKTPRLQ